MGADELVHLVDISHVAELVGDHTGPLVLVMDDPGRSRVEVSRRQAGALRKALGWSEPSIEACGQPG